MNPHDWGVELSVNAELESSIAKMKADLPLETEELRSHDRVSTDRTELLTPSKAAKSNPMEEI